jgi:hypothetical protein
VEVRTPGPRLLHFCLWGWWKEKNSCQEVRNGDHLLIRIQVAAADVRNLPKELVSARGSIRRRYEPCVNEEGGHVEHLL